VPFGSQVCGRLLEARAAIAAAVILLHVAHDHVVADLRFPLAMNPMRLSSRRATGPSGIRAQSRLIETLPDPRRSPGGLRRSGRSALEAARICR
jgi:hypothetical protein